ncbi:MAG: AhpC/TSA family protein, partial [Paramuribaculum sp.]|nr:AhpC/TSA family protein [Paramuribaculum sp.]
YKVVYIKVVNLVVLNMKLRLVAAALVAVCLSSYAQNAENNFRITGKVTNVPDSAVVRLLRPLSKVVETIVADTICDGSFTLTGNVNDGNNILYLIVDGRGFPNRFSKIVVFPGAEINITGDGVLYPLWTVESPSPLQESITAVTASQMPEFEEALKYSIEETDLMYYIYVENKGAEEVERETWKKINALRKKSAPCNSIVDAKKLAYMATAPIDDIWLYECLNLVDMLRNNPDRSDAEMILGLTNRIDDEQYATKYGKRIKALMSIDGNLKTGDVMPHAEFVDVDGKTHDLSEFEGKSILLDFWSAGCGPCVMSFAEAEEVATKYADKLAFVSVSQDEAHIWKEALDRYKLNGIQWNGYRDEGVMVFDKFGNMGIPFYVFITPDGVIKNVWTGYGEGYLMRKVDSLMKD